jgi:predicted MPP superfamily phosphohydrolase
MFLKSTAAIIVFLLSVSCATNLQIHQHQIEHQEIPESWAGTRILFFADTQFNPHLPKEYFLRFLEEVQATQPEFILIPGDHFRSLHRGLGFCVEYYGGNRSPGSHICGPGQS